ncbi:EamA family transporter [Anoxybacteroides tepidamans]|uniref:EamA family transporter n=1 Tax=Anoxybacteroides tepidamans TaxID=265948 RepID=UPI0030811F64
MWGGAFIAGKIATESLHPVTVAFFRFFGASYSVIGKVVMKKYSPLTATTYATGFGTILLSPLAIYYTSLDSIKSSGWEVWLSVLYMYAQILPAKTRLPIWKLSPSGCLNKILDLAGFFFAYEEILHKSERKGKQTCRLQTQAVKKLRKFYKMQNALRLSDCRTIRSALPI